MGTTEPSKGTNKPLEDLVVKAQRKDMSLFGDFFLCGLYAIAAFYLAYFPVNNIQHHNSVTKHGNERVVRKADGIFSYTMIGEYNGGGIEVTRVGSTPPSLDCDPSSITYIDKNGDGKVDEISFFPAEIFTLSTKYCDGGYLRGTNFEEQIQLFLDADRVLKEQIQRFKPYLERYNTP